MSVLLVGDSLGVGLSGHLSAYSVCREGVSTAEWVSATRNAINSYNPDIVLVSLGTNDLYGAKNRPPSETASAAAQIVAAAAGRLLLWILPPVQPALQDRGTIAAIQSIAPNVFDSRQYSIPLASDRVHPTGQGYQIMASAILSRLNSMTLGGTSATLPDDSQSGGGDGLPSDGESALPQLLIFALAAVVLLRFIED